MGLSRNTIKELLFNQIIDITLRATRLDMFGENFISEICNGGG